MTTPQLQLEIQDVFRRIFGDETLVVTSSTSQEDIEAWDSLEHINILSIIEQRYGIKFDLNEVMEIKTAGDIMQLVSQKVHG
jgi:acyl carrier protein